MSTPIEPENTPIEPLEPQTAQIGELQEPQNTPKYDEDFINELVTKIDKKLERKLYYGRKQQKSDEKQTKKLENMITKPQKESVAFYIISGILIFASAFLCYFGVKRLKKENLNENNA